MDEMLPGFWHWSTFRETIGIDVSSYWVEPAGIVIDPMVPPDAGLDWFEEREVRPQQVVLTIGLHWRDSSEFADRFGIGVRAPAAALERFAGTDREVERYEWGDEVAPGVTAVEIGASPPTRPPCTSTTPAARWPLRTGSYERRPVRRSGSCRTS